MGNVFPSGKTLPRSWGTFSRAGKPCRARGEHFPKRENLAALVGNVFPSGETLLRSAATLLRAWKSCCVLRQHFYEHGNLAAFCGNTFMGIKTLLRFAATLQQAWKHCCAARQGFNDKLLAAIILCSPTSGRMRYAPTVGGEKLTRNDASHHRVPQRINSKYVGAYRIRPPQRRTCQAMENVHRKTKVGSPPSFPIRPRQGVCNTPPQLAEKNLHETMPSINASPTNQ